MEKRIGLLRDYIKIKRADSEETTLKESKYTRFDSAEINQILQHDIGLNYQRTVNLYGRTLEAFFAESGSQL